MIFRKLTTDLFETSRQTANEIRVLLHNISLGASEIKKDETKYPKARFWHSGHILYRSILLDLGVSEYGNKLSVKIIQKDSD